MKRWLIHFQSLPVIRALIFSAAVLAGLHVQPAIAQRDAGLDNQVEALNKRIATISSLLKNSSADKEASLDRLVAVQRQIAQREDLIALLRLQIDHADGSVQRTEHVMQSLQTDIDTLVASYGRMARAALRQGLLDNRLAFLLGADSFSESYSRYLYLQKYDQNRKRQLDLIRKTREDLTRKLATLKTIKEERQVLLIEELREQARLEAMLAEENELLQALSGDTQRLEAELRDQRKAKNKLDRIVAAALAKARKKAAEEAEAAARAAEAKAKANATAEAPRASVKKTTPRADNSGFRQNKGRLPWPVAEGFITKPYGESNHPSLKRVKVNNNGIDIRTQLGAAVRPVYAGTVIGIQDVPGYHTMVIVQHADYFTVYSNLSDVQVKVGAAVAPEDQLGTVASRNGGSSAELHFEIWKDKDSQNPSRWIVR